MSTRGRSPLGVVLVVLLAAIACGESAREDDLAVSPDGGPGAPGDGDAGPPPRGAIGRFDWREARGEPLAGTVVARLAEGAIEAVTAGSVALRGGCGPAGCDFTVVDAEGRVRAAHAGLVDVHAEATSPGGDRAVLLALAGRDECLRGEWTYERLRGDLVVVDLATGGLRALLENVSTQALLEPAFTRSGAWIDAATLSDGGCNELALRHFAGTPPHAPGAVDDTSFLRVDELQDGRWAGFLTGTDQAAMVEPGSTAAPEVLTDGVQEILVSRGWVHAFAGWPIRRVVSRAADGATHTWTIDATRVERFPSGASGRFALACGLPKNERVPCVVHDALEELPDRTFELPATATRRVAVLSAAELVVWVDRHPLDGPVTERLDLRSGARDVVAEGASSLHVVGDDEALVLHTADDRALLVEADGVETLAERVERVTTIGPRGAGALLPQSHLALIASRGPVWGEPLRLDVLDLRARRLVRLTDRLHWAPGPHAPFERDCGAPWLARAGGGVGQTLRAPAAALHFLELPRPGEAADATLHLVPVDLSEPPRALARMHPVYCEAPLVSADGRRAALAITQLDGTRDVLSAAWLAP